MKRIAVLILFYACFQSATAQENTIDSAKEALATYKNPLERFTATIKYLETVDILSSNTIDSALCVDLLQIAQQLKNDSLLAISYNWIGYFFSIKKGDNTTALEYYFKALPLAQKFNDKRRISSIYFDMASVYFNLKNIDEYYSNTVKGGENLPDKSSPKYYHMLVQYQRNMGIYYVEKGNLDSALYYGQAAEQSNKPINGRVFKTQTLSLIGDSYAKMKEDALADVYFNKAKVASDSIFRKDIFFRRLLPFLITRNRMKEAELQAENFWETAQQMQNQNVILLAADFKQQVFDKLNKIDSAYYYSKIGTETRERIFNQNNQNAIQGMAFKEQLRVMEEAAKKSAEEEQRKQNIQYALIGIGIITFLLLFLMLSRSIIVTEKWISFFGILGLLIVFEFINLLIHPFLERVTHHSPVLMLMALVALASLLIPLHHRMEKWINEKMTEKNKKIRLENAKKTIQQLDNSQN